MQRETQPTVWAMMSQSKELADFHAAITKDIAMSAKLRSSGPKAIFAPISGAKTKILESEAPADPGEAASRDAQLKLLLHHHLCLARLTAGELRDQTGIDMFSGQRVAVHRESAEGRDGMVLDGAARILRTIECSDGIIHIIDQPLMPSIKTLIEALESDGRFKILVSLLEKPSAAKTLEVNWAFTFIAPTVEACRVAFELDPTLPAQLNRPRELERFLRYSLLLGRLYPDDLRSRVSTSRSRGQAELQTLLGKPRKVAVVNTGLQIDGAMIDTNPIESIDGLILVVNKLSLPVE